MFAGSKECFSSNKLLSECLLYTTTFDLFNRGGPQRKSQLISYTLSYVNVFVFYLFATRINESNGEETINKQTAFDIVNKVL